MRWLGFVPSELASSQCVGGGERGKWMVTRVLNRSIGINTVNIGQCFGKR